MKMKDLWMSKEDIVQEEQEAREQMEYEDTRARAEAILINKMAEEYTMTESLSSEERDVYSNLFDRYRTGINYLKGKKILYMSNVYEIREDHKSTEELSPDVSSDNYKLIYKQTTPG